MTKRQNIKLQINLLQRKEKRKIKDKGNLV